MVFYQVIRQIGIHLGFDAYEYSVDELEIELSNNLSETALEYLSEDATVGVKARIAQRNLTVGKTTMKVHAIIAEKLTFINTKKQEE